ncbi:glycoside hydrolase family 28 protein [Vallitalea pronyensis]|uniref:Glycoside hydrolase family 28 protein n=1 Tax=Vallitalea pronyensis TaxID=1348613 RepID=A0A8J8MI77_9FIRM|nr:glycoside hydrolase family 28 protein [Vallitalea pronyensis]QUI22115.1 glycoside hydrolase family 28 protein [Vallitalea pronyensis]
MIYNVRDFGAIGDGLTDDTQAIQDAMDACSNTDGEVIIPQGVYQCGTVYLRSKMTLNIKQHAVLLGSDVINDYVETQADFTDAVGQKRGRCLLLGFQVKDVHVKGEGCICGRGHGFVPEEDSFPIRPFLVRFIACEDIDIEGITLRDAGAWCLHLHSSRNITISHVTIDNHVNRNNDGIDIDACSHVLIQSCYINTGDDAICLKTTKDEPCEHIVVKHCVISSHWSGFKIGTESVGDFRDIQVEDCFFYDIKGCAIKIVPVDGGHVEGVKIRRINLLRCTGPIFVASGNRLNTYFNEARSEPGTIKQVIIEHVCGDVIEAVGNGTNGLDDAKGCVVISGILEQPVEDIIIRSCDLSMPGGVKTIREAYQVPEMEDRYPEFGNFGILPAYGFFLRHGKNITLENNVIRLKKEDCRLEVVKEDIMEDS